MRRGWALALIAVVLLVGCDAPTRPEHTVRIRRYSFAAVVQPDGAIQMTATVEYPSDDGGPLRLGAPTLGTVDDLEIDGSPRTSSGETVDVDPRGAKSTVVYVVQGAVERYADGAIVTLPVWTAPNDVSGDDVRVPVEGELTLPAAATSKVRWHGASPANETIDATSAHFNGELATNTTSEITFVLPSDAVPAAPLLAGASRVASYEDRQAPLDSADRTIAGDIKNAKTREDLEANVYWGAVGLEVAIPFLITLLVVWRGAVVRRRAERGLPPEISDPPSDMQPALVSLLVAKGKDIGNEAIAATILDLGQRGALHIEGITSQRYTMKVVGTSSRRGELALLTALRGAANQDGLVLGPPLPIKHDADWWKWVRQDVVASARQASLLRRRYPSGLFLTAVVALAITTLPLYARSPETIVGGVVVATILGALPFIGGYVLTGAGHRERVQWEGYRRHLETADLGDVGVPGIVVWEKGLVYGAALGVATTAIGDLS